METEITPKELESVLTPAEVSEPEQEEISAPREGGFSKFMEEYAAQNEEPYSPLADIYETLQNLQCNVAQLVQNQATAADVVVLQRENEAFRADSNIKLMRAYGIDAMIRLYQAISERLFRLHHPTDETWQTDEGEEKALLWVLKRMALQFKKLGIRLQTSVEGTEFSGETMAVYGDNGEEVEENETIFPANEEHSDGTIKESVCPAFIWTIPSLIGEKREWCMEPEKVCIYKD